MIIEYINKNDNLMKATKKMGELNHHHHINMIKYG